jgi:uncharacterized protein YndB with AHSA1/START domain
MTQTVTQALTTVDGRHQLRIERELAHPVERVWTAITDPAELSRWFPATVELELRRGAPVRYSTEPGEPPQTGTVLEVDPPRVLGLTWDDDVLRFELSATASGEGCRLVFTHVFDDLAGAASFASGWDACLSVLDDVVAGREPRPTAAMDVAHEDRVTNLGLRVGGVAPTPAGWQIRVERQLVRPAEVVRPLLPPPDDHVRWELGEGTGHGARLVVTAGGPPDEESARRTLELLHDRVEALARGLLEQPAQPIRAEAE